MFAAETLAGIAACDALIQLIHTLQEMQFGPLTPADARRLREQGGYMFYIVINRKPVFVRVHKITQQKQSLEKS